MSLSARKELLAAIRSKYLVSCIKDKTKILDGFIAATGLKRKYAISLLNSKLVAKAPQKKRGRKPKYYTFPQKMAHIEINKMVERG